MNPLNYTDAYKLHHRPLYPKVTTKVVSNLTPRSNKHYSGTNTDGMVVAGIGRFVRKMLDDFDKYFFSKDKSTVVGEYASLIRSFTGMADYDVSHIEALHDLQYIPLEIRSFKEGTLCPIGVPMMTITNTHEDFFWLVNYMETYISAELWGVCTSATIAREYRQILEKYGKLTGTPADFIKWQAHDFSMRGMYGVEAAKLSGLGHLMFFFGTDTIVAYLDAIQYYDADKYCEIVGGSIPATEHSIQCAYMEEGEEEDEYLLRVIREYPTGNVGLVCDGIDYFHFMTVTVPKYKKEIMARDGRLVFRPDSGDPVDIICGFNFMDVHEIGTPQQKGSMEILWDIFGGTEVKGTDGKMYKHLDTHVGLIYGDSITLKRCRSICERLVAKNFSTNNLVLGIGSYTYQFNTRDTFGTAMKATYIEVNHVGKEIFKNPKTVVGTPKKSAKGLVTVIEEDGVLKLVDQATWEDVESKDNMLRIVCYNGASFMETNFENIRLTAEATL